MMQGRAQAAELNPPEQQAIIGCRRSLTRQYSKRLSVRWMRIREREGGSTRLVSGQLPSRDATLFVCLQVFAMPARRDPHLAR